MLRNDRARVLVTRKLPSAVEARLCADYDTTLNADDIPLGADDLRRALLDFDAILPTITDRLGSDLLGEAAHRARILTNFGAGTDHIDLAAANAAGIAVTNTPDALTETTAELAITLMLMAARRAGEGERHLRAGEWHGWRPTHLLGTGLHGKVLGLLGFGRIAQATARRAMGLGMRIAYHSRSRAAPDVESRFSAIWTPSLEALAAQADVLSLHVPGGTATRHLVNTKMLGAMQAHAVLINTARGSVVDEAALATALAEGVISAAGLDVYENEPAVDARLRSLENVVLLPHLGSATLEARTAMGMQAADNLDAFFAGLPLPNRVA